jgi:hypothetical protein
MAKCRLFQLLASLTIVVFLLCGQQVVAQDGPNHLQHRLVQRIQTDRPDSNPPPAANLFPLSAGMSIVPTPLDGGGNDFWPCFPNNGAPNEADCSTVPAGGATLGVLGYTISYANCDASQASSPEVCGQIYWFYEDDTNDTSDPLKVSLEVKQGTKVILDTGLITLADPNPYPAGSIITIYDDTAFGTLGGTGKGNGYCGGTKVVCVNPVPGLATATVVTEVGTHKLTQKFNIWLE